MFHRSPTNSVPVVTLDDATLLLAEKATRTAHARANSAVIGGTASLLLLSPMAVFGIARSAQRSRRSVWSHDELIAEVRRRGLTVLEKTQDESAVVLVGAQLAAVVLGNAVAGQVEHLVQPIADITAGALASSTRLVAGKATDVVVSNSVIAGVDKVSAGVASKQSAALDTAAGTQSQPVYSLPPSPPASDKKKMNPFAFTLALFSPKPEVIAATAHLSGEWTGTAISILYDPIDTTSTSPEAANPEQPEEARPLPAVPTGLPPPLTEPITPAKASISSSLDSLKNAIATVQASTNTALAQTRTSITSAANAFKAAASESGKNVTARLCNTANAVITVVKGAGTPDETKQEVIVPVQYRMKFNIHVQGVTVSGKNLVDDLAISGRCHESGTRIEFMETLSETAEVGAPVNVMYRAKVSGGYMNGTWETSDGRTGTFTLSHV
ncbi:hypothetical protein BJ741DRAFT_586454 [Chytriomyces cf. hyalinus JEL632]|nr:hypothetical protein BJ741DRAFT_586454 [Chytriomyces cf. hyalinus JEL632]